MRNNVQAFIFADAISECQQNATFQKQHIGKVKEGGRDMTR